MTRSEYVEDGVQPGKELNVIPISSLLFSSLLFTSTELFLSRTLAKSNKIFFIALRNLFKDISTIKLNLSDCEKTGSLFASR